MYFAQITLDGRQIRQLSQDKQVMQENITRLEALIDENQLADRDLLQKEIQELQAKLQESQTLKEVKSFD